MADEVNPALTETPADSVALGEMRQRLNIAVAIDGAELSEANQIRIAEAISKASPVDMVVGVFDVFTAPSDPENPESAAVWTGCGAVLKSRAIEVAEIIVEHSFHGKGDAAAAFAAAARASLTA